MNGKERTEFELVYYDVAVQDINHYATGTPLPPFSRLIIDNYKRQSAGWAVGSAVQGTQPVVG